MEISDAFIMFNKDMLYIHHNEQFFKCFPTICMTYHGLYWYNVDINTVKVLNIEKFMKINLDLILHEFASSQVLGKVTKI